MERGDGLSRMGRPKIDNPKSTQLSVRLDKETLRQLDESAKILNKSRVEVLRLGIKKVFWDLKQE